MARVYNDGVPFTLVSLGECPAPYVRLDRAGARLLIRHLKSAIDGKETNTITVNVTGTVTKDDFATRMAPPGTFHGLGRASA